MKPVRAVVWSLRVYDLLLRAYPPRHRARFGVELRQVFSLLCRDAYAARGSAGVAMLWLPVLADWAWTAAVQWIHHFTHPRRLMMTTGLDQQIGDLTWAIVTGLRAGFSIRQVFEVLAGEAPEPAASACRRLLEILTLSGSLESALAEWVKSVPSPALARLAAALTQDQESSGNLADQLEPLIDQLLAECGTDPAFYPALRREAEMLGANIPARVAGWQEK